MNSRNKIVQSGQTQVLTRWPDPAKIVDQVTHYPETQFQLWLKFLPDYFVYIIKAYAYYTVCVVLLKLWLNTVDANFIMPYGN